MKLRKCRLNDGVLCPIEERECADCGWNPEVGSRRLASIRRRLEWKRAWRNIWSTYRMIRW